MYEDRTEENIKKEMLDNISDEVDKTENKFINNAITPAAIKFAETYIELDYIANKLDVKNLEGEELERFIYQRTGIKRKPATKATTVVIVLGQEGAKISKGDLVATDTINFIVQEDITIDESGQARVFVVCERYGIVGNVPANSINKFPISIPGLIDVYNPEQITNGYNAETDNELRVRYYEKLQRPAKAGNKYHYEQWAKEVTGVGGIRVVPRWNGPLTVKVVIIDSNGQPASQDLIDNTFNHIESERPFGANVTVASAEPVEINISVTLALAEGYEDLRVKEDISKNIAEYLKSIAFKTNYISYAQIGSIILDTDGALDYSNLQVNNGIVNIPIGSEEVAIMGVIE
mgnify:CR=1 FL=1